ncbi:hypothetical protein GQX73_g1979 [Xylaria multiplex]|uniref:Methyltransferase domain-containing protein n=1 Tax=Xylaria multiplex TaxID=323545 RepID=A0A7C8MX42_9PEZI|nr:hypothetical protein GQX73_g1979 [Xylaria multiplex]
MVVERPAGRSGRGNSLLVSALRFAGYDLDYRPATPTPTPTPSSETDPAKAGAVSAGGEEYSGIPAEDVDRHVYQMRDRLWDVYPYACVGRFRFISLEFTADAYYQVALFRLLRAQTESETDDNETRLLDVGCCVGQVLRKLVFDGVDSSRLYGTDVEPRFLDIGFDLFRDRDKFQGGFVVGDLLQQNTGDERLDAFDGRMTFIHATSFFHLFTWDDQVRAATRMVRFLQPERRDVMIFGRQVGTTSPRDNGKAGSDKVYLHNANSWQRLWDEVGELTSTKWKTTMESTETIETGAGGVESSLKKMTFCVSRG